jgi:inosine/xanthosine triphosphate pyrophosphatase family protein
MFEGYTDRRAEAVCYVASFDGESYIIASGRVPGTIVTEAIGENGF